MRVRVCTLLASECTPTRDETKSSLLSHLANLRKIGYITKFTGTMKTSYTYTHTSLFHDCEETLASGRALGALNFMVNYTEEQCD